MKSPQEKPNPAPRQPGEGGSVFNRFVTTLGELNERLSVIARNAAGALLAVMTVIVMLGVVSRYAINASLPWTEEASKTMMVWTAFMVAPWGLRHGAHVSIDLFADALPGRIKAFVETLIIVAILWIIGVFFIESLALVERGAKGRLSTIPISSAVVYSVIPPMLALLFSVAFEAFLKKAAMLVTGAGPDTPPPVSRREA